MSYPSTVRYECTVEQESFAEEKNYESNLPLILAEKSFIYTYKFMKNMNLCIYEFTFFNL